MLQNMKSSSLKALDSLVSVKVGVIALSTALLCLSKIDQSTWQQTILIILGYRTVNEVVSMVKSKNG